MTTDETEILTMHHLQHLRVMEPDVARAERVRARCRAAIIRRQPKADNSTSSAAYARLVIESAVIGALCAGYLFAVARDVLRLRGN
jgi:hypothetical protein